VEGDVDHDDTAPEEESALHQERGLVVEQVLPPSPGNELRDLGRRSCDAPTTGR